MKNLDFNTAFVYIPNRFKVDKKILVKDLTYSQMEIQVKICDKRCQKLMAQKEELKNQNSLLNRDKSESARKQQQYNVNKIIDIENKYEFVIQIEDFIDFRMRKLKQLPIEYFENQSVEFSLK